MATVRLQGVSKSYEKQLILRNIHLDIQQGEFVTVVGPSGCGKSTLLRLVAGLDTVSEGQILINRQCVNQMPAASRDMAMVFQNYALYPHMSAYDNMAYGLKRRGMAKAAIQQRVLEVARLLRLDDYLHRKPSMLSGGQRQRVAMGRAIVRSPAVFLFDEPLSNLDAKLRTEMRHEIKKLHQQLKTTCLYVTHDQTEAMTMASRVVVLNQGQVEQFGTPQEIYQQPASLFVAGFMGHYPMNLFALHLDAQQAVVHTALGIDLPLPKIELPQGKPLLLGIRAEHLRLCATNEPYCFMTNIEFIDDMGSDKLVQVLSEQGLRLNVRVPGDFILDERRLALSLEWQKAHIFCQETGQRLGGWNG